MVSYVFICVLCPVCNTIFDFDLTQNMHASRTGTAVDEESYTSATSSKIFFLTCPDSKYFAQGQVGSIAGATVKYVFSNGALCFEAEVDGTGGWIGVGISSQGGRMVGDAAIGSAGTVDLYTLHEYGVAKSDKQTLSGTSITEEDGKTIMKFAMSGVGSGAQHIIVAHGTGGIGYHNNNRGSFVATPNELVLDADVEVEEETMMLRH